MPLTESALVARPGSVREIDAHAVLVRILAQHGISPRTLKIGEVALNWINPGLHINVAMAAVIPRAVGARLGDLNADVRYQVHVAVDVLFRFANKQGPGLRGCRRPGKLARRARRGLARTKRGAQGLRMSVWKRAELQNKCEATCGQKRFADHVLIPPGDKLKELRR